MTCPRAIFLFCLSASLFALSGCVGGTTPPSQFYLLEPIRDVEANAPRLDSTMLLALAPVRLPKYADRPQIVSATARNAYRVDELNRWAEPLDENVTRLLVQNLSQLIPAEVLPTRTSNLAIKAKYRLSVNILEFHVDPEGAAVLNVQWIVTRGREQVLHRGKEYRSNASTSDYALMVAALNDCLNRMSRDIADSVKMVSDR